MHIEIEKIKKTFRSYGFKELILVSESLTCHTQYLLEN